MNSKNEILFEFSNDEQVVREYQCTQLRRLFFPPTLGFLTVTNRRVLYHSQGKSLVGKSAIIAEIPINDVGGISATVGVSINWLLFLLLAGLAYWVSLLLSFEAPFLFNGVVLGILVAPYLLTSLAGYLVNKGILSQEFIDRIREIIKELPIEDSLKQKGGEYYERIFYILFMIGLPLLAFRLTFMSTIGYRQETLAYLLLGGAYFWIFLRLFGKSRRFSLKVGSKTASGAGISIEGNAFRPLFWLDSSAAQTMNAAPARDAERVVQEIGALVMDIRLLGELGVRKWA